jgi:L,D-transpeptidase ErfK/SrfK
MDPWAPPARQAVTLPTSWILPQAPYQGIVVNIPEMRLYYFSQTKSGMNRRMVMTAPVGIGRPSWQTPEATFTVRGKTENPTWVIPASIRKERIQKKGWSEQMIPGGVPENPLGKYRLRLSIASYAIHGTTNPWTIGRATTHGCVRLYPEDIAQLFPSVPVGTRGAFVYQPVKVGVRDQRIYIEVHKDVYGRVPDLLAEAQRVVEQSSFAEVVDPFTLAEAVHDQAGYPVDVTRERDGLPAW